MFRHTKWFCLFLRVSTLSLSTFLVRSSPVEATIIQLDRTEIYLSSETTHSDNLRATSDGLALPQPAGGTSAEFWVLSKAFPIGLSWRPPSSARLTINVEGNLKTNFPMNAFVRYSCDAGHWSSWYALRQTTTTLDRNAVVSYEGEVDIPNYALKGYRDLMSEWWKTQPDWSSDEDAYCRWLVKRDSGFFKRHFPFIGYVQVLVEGFYPKSGVLMSKVLVDTQWGIGGLASIPKHPRPQGYDQQKWHFPK